jgi:serine/threonine protein kinase
MPDPAPDILLKKYRLERLLGQGASAQVYLATHLELNAPRALKVLRRDAPGLGSSEYNDFVGRFRLEAQLALLDHPNVVRVHDFEREGETLILVMEYCPGGSLNDRLGRARKEAQPVPLDECLRISVDVAQGLSAVHQLDAVHRDLKPSNILFDLKGRAKVADLGLAQVPGGPSARSQLSQPLPHPGTSGYMSPEQEHSGAALKPPSDVYALGLILFELLSGRNYGYLKPGTRVQSLRLEVPAWLDDLLARMLAASRWARTMGEAMSSRCTP